MTDFEEQANDLSASAGFEVEIVDCGCAADFVVVRA